MPAPGSSLAAALVLWFGVAAILGPVIGRHLKRVSAQYPPAKTDDAPDS